ncbi:MAG TPA: polyhydroxyalkanoate synthesis repressor PhaR [Thermohalobaculum sp.]|nr:polyhydroxyalkanoate synthesis repressor PhaR [Thermohalobaculum sp.]
MAARDSGKADAEGSEKIVIKKYANRRLYNTAKSSYVTLDDLSKMVRAGQDFAVYDAKTGEDITRSVLTQIIVEEEAKGHAMLPTAFLRQIIGLYGDALQTVVPGYLEASMKTFGENQERMRKAFGGSHAIANLEALTRSNMEWFEQALRLFSPLAAGQGGKAPERNPGAEAERGAGSKAGREPGREASHELGAPGDFGENLDQLQRQIREMQEQLDRLSRGKG